MTKYGKKSKISMISCLGLCLLLAALFVFVGCNPDDVIEQTDEGHIESYLLNVGKAVDLLRTDGVFPGTPYQWAGDSATYYDSVLSFSRGFETLVGEPVDYGYLGWLNESIARVSDDFLVRTYRIVGNDTTFTDANRLLVRSAFMLKLGDDRQYFLGWDMWGMGQYNQTFPPLSVGIWFPDSTSLRGDFDSYDASFQSIGGTYKVLSTFKVLTDSLEARIDAEIRNPSIPTRFLIRVSYTSPAGYVSQRLGMIDAEHATGMIFLGEQPEIAYDFMVISTYDPVTKAFIQAWTVPYRVNPI